MTADRETVWVNASELGEAPSRLVDVAAWAERLLSKIPPDMRDKATVEIGDVSYERPETDAEYMARLSKQRESAALKEASERREWERLKAKYPDGAPPAGPEPPKGVGMIAKLEWIERVQYPALRAKYGADTP
jgi:hypothetical protein